METCDPSKAVNAAEDQTLETARQEDVIEKVIVEQTAVAEDPEAAAEDEMTAAGDTQAEAVEELTAEALLAKAKAIAEKPAADISGDELRRLRQQYATLHKNETELARKAWLDAGNDAGSFVEQADGTGEQIAAIIADAKERKAAFQLQQDAMRAENLERKNAIIDEILALAEDTDNVNRTFARYRELQDEFNATGEVPPTDDTAVWKRFQEARERYTDHLKINKELRDYDFKKNLDSKQLLLDEAAELVIEDDVILAYRRLQELHNKWRQIGPVAKEIRDEIWDKFKSASAEINKRYQAHFEARKTREAENEAAKTAICERIEALDYSSVRSFSAWDAMTKTIIEAQNEWKTLGFASRKANNALFARFRELCDKFFAAKSEFFANTRDEHAKNLSAKTALVEMAESLKDSTEWRKTTDRLVELQKQWKSIGTVGKKHSDAIWQRFMAACDYFFEQKKKATSGVRQEENANLKAKRDIIDRLDKIDATQPRDEAIAALRALQTEWQGIGHVPFREKDKLYDAYRDKVNALRTALNVKENQQRIDRFETDMAEIEGDATKLYRERERLLRSADTKRNEIRTYENNLCFFSSKSKTGDTMVRDMQRKIERLKSDLQLIDEKVRLIDSKL